jgi:Ca2+-binding RTX toxin-like protein
MWFSSVFARLTRKQPFRPARRRSLSQKPESKQGRRFCRPNLEVLEDRILLTDNIFTTLASNLGHLTAAQSALNSALNTASKIPLLTQNNAGILGTFQDAQVITDNVAQNIQTALNNPSYDTDAKMASGLAQVLGVGPNDVKITDDITKVEIEVHFSRTLSDATLPVNFNLNVGLPGLPVNIGASTQGSISAKLAYDLALGFGYDPAKGGFFVDPSSKASDFNMSLPNHELSLHAGITPSDDFVATSSVGLLQATIDNSSHGSSLDARVDLDNLGVDHSGNPSQPSVSLSGNANLNLHVAASFTPASPTFTFPGVGADLIVNWDLSGSSPDVEFKNVSFELGSFLSKFAGPIIQDIQQFTQPLQPVFDALTRPLPGLSDLSHLIGGGDVNLLGVAEKAAGYVYPGVDKAIEVVGTLIQIVEDINQLKSSSGNLYVPLGDFALNTPGDTSSLLNDMVDFSNLSQSGVDLAANLLSGIQSSNIISDIDDAARKLGLGDVAKQELKDLGQALGDSDNGFKFNFPILDNPASVIFPLLLGHDSDLASFDANITLNAPSGGVPGGLSAFGLGISITGNVAFESHLHVGYDTFGLREFFADSNPADLLDGFYISDPTPMRPQFSIGGALTAHAGVSSGFFGVNVTGGVWTGDDPDHPEQNPIQVALHDPNWGGDDGKLRLSKIDPNWLFDVGGKLEAGLGVTVQVGFQTFVGFVGYQHTFSIATVTLLDLSVGKLGQGGLPATDPPVLTGVNSGIMTLFLGTSAGQRQNVPNDPGDTPQVWTVSHKDGDPDGTLTVNALGVSQTLMGVTRIVAVGGLAGQTITIEDGVNVPADLTGGQGPNTLTYLDTQAATLIGGPGDDKLTVGPNAHASTLQGGGGNDTLIGGAGADTLNGGGGPNDTDSLFAGPGNNQVLNGGQGTNQFYAGTGSCQMNGGPGSNFFDWRTGHGAIHVVGQGNSNTLTVCAIEPGDSLVADPNGNGVSVRVSLGQTTLGVIPASDIQVVNIDDAGGNASYTINDLTGTGVQNVNVNLHEVGSPDWTTDGVTENVATNVDTVAAVTIGTATGNSHKRVNGDPAQPELYGQVTTTDVSEGPRDGVMMGTYWITTAVPNTTDRLVLNTHGGPDTITIHATQAGGVSTDPNQIPNQPGGQVTVNTYDGTDTLKVGFYTLDDFFGPLNLFAQSGSVDQLTFNESSSYVNDLDRLSATQLVRYAQPLTVTVTHTTLPPYDETAYPFIFNFQPLGGSFSPGVVFDTGQGQNGTVLFIPETGLNEPVTVNSDCVSRPETLVVVGYDGANIAGATTIEGIPVNSPFAATAAGSTLALLNSALLVDGTPSGDTQLQVDDLGALTPESYTLRVRTVPLPPIGELVRSGAAAIDYGPYVQLALNGGGHGNTIAVQGVLGNTTARITAGAGNDTITVGNPSHTLIDIVGALTIDGQGGNDTLSVRDDGSSSAQAYTLSAASFVRQPAQLLPAVVINFTHVATLAFDASNNSGLNHITVNGTPSGVPVTVNAGSGDAVLEVDNLDAIGGPLSFNWLTGNKSLTVDDHTAAGSDTYRLDSVSGQTTLARSQASPITLSGLLHILNLAVGQLHDNTIDVDSLASNTIAGIHAGNGADSVFVSDPGRSLNTIRGNLSIFGTGHTQVTLDDRSGPSPRIYTLQSPLLQFDPSLPPIQFSFLGALTLDAANSATVNVRTTDPGDQVQISLQGGSNQVNVGSLSQTLTPILGPVLVTGQSGSDHLVLNDQNHPTASYLIGTSAVALAGGAAISFVNLGTVTLNGGTGTTQYHVVSVPNIAFLINALGGSNSMFGPNQNNLWRINGANLGTLDGTLVFNDFQNLIGSGNNAFVFQPAGSISGTVAGGAGTNTLDYSALAGGVVVDLPLGRATATGSVQGIQNVTGGAGNNIIVGMGAGVLRGGAGRSLLIAGSGGAGATLIGGSGEDILIGGHTIYDGNIPALQMILAEWASAHSFAQRITFLTQGGGLNGPYVLTTATVVHNGVNTLTGGGGRNWFFAHLGSSADTMTDFNSALDYLTSI